MHYGIAYRPYLIEETGKYLPVRLPAEPHPHIRILENADILAKCQVLGGFNLTIGIVGIEKPGKFIGRANRINSNAEPTFDLANQEEWIGESGELITEICSGDYALKAILAISNKHETGIRDCSDMLKKRLVVLNDNGTLNQCVAYVGRWASIESCASYRFP